MDNFATKIRIETLKMLRNRGFGHIGGSMSIVEALSVLYDNEMTIDPSNPDWEDRDYFVLSKGHAGPALYSTLALKGYFDKQLLNTLNEAHTNLPSHADRLKTPGVDMTTGSLGQGISAAAGIAKALKIQKKNNRVYAIVGDGELNEGQVYEALMFAFHHKLDNLVLMIDENKLQLDGYTDDICDQGDIRLKIAGFGWHALRVDGHNEAAIKHALQEAKEIKKVPTCVVLDTIKAKGVSFLENNTSNHHVRFTDKQIKELEHLIKQLEGDIT
ncbi:MAG: transketolase [Candidatus Izimaplasma sp.]|nr:transketolase [Candidatus Izimaplasma bacterium]